MGPLVAKYLAFVITSSVITGCSAIVGGQPSNRYHFFASIHVDRGLCGGTIISPNAVLTSARCLFLPGKARFARPHEIRIHKDSRNYKCARYVTHPKYSPYPDAPYDLAVLKLDECFHLGDPGIGFLRRCPTGYIYEVAHALGMGKTQKLPEEIHDQVMEAKLFRYRPCRELLVEYGLHIDTTSRICFVNNQLGVDKGVSPGDFGGPLVYKNVDIKDQSCLLGVASFSIKANYSNTLISVFTELPNFELFLEQTINAFFPPCDVYDII